MTDGDLQCQTKTKIGFLYLTACPQGLTRVCFSKQNIPLLKRLDVSKPAEKILRDTLWQLKEYFDGKRQRFDLPLCFQGPAFQKKVWQALSEIPLGKTVSYREIAQKIKNPKAVRAVGCANGKNPFFIIIPCHRVISADGTLGGYSGGVGFKRALLKHEGVSFE